MLNYDRTAGLAKITCDTCGTSMESVSGRIARDATNRAVDLAKLAKWSIEKRAGGWQHFCPSCRTTRNRGSLL
jgi:hypothetical protein